MEQKLRKPWLLLSSFVVFGIGQHILLTHIDDFVLRVDLGIILLGFIAALAGIGIGVCVFYCFYKRHGRDKGLIKLLGMYIIGTLVLSLLTGLLADAIYAFTSLGYDGTKEVIGGISAVSQSLLKFICIYLLYVRSRRRSFGLSKEFLTLAVTSVLITLASIGLGEAFGIKGYIEVLGDILILWGSVVYLFVYKK